MRLLIRVERPLDAILRFAMLVNSACMINDDRLRLPIRRSKSAADHVAEEAVMLGGTRENAATN
jgi:hypothetical protein